ncbi:MAG: hydantoinase/oxoprolinase family protein, partial [Balneolaceae bacterium]|nr:hydantoinase/oxoprolinase family protein [Balneolaceae bacterium]
MKSWQIWIDTGGTFTDCIALNPEGRTGTAKVLSNSTLRGKTVHWIDDRRLEIDQDWNVPSDFIKGFTFRLMKGDMQPVEVLSYDAEASVIGLSRQFETATAEGLSFEVASEEEAPELGMRMLTQTRPDEPLPPLDLRLATTKGTNALLERKGTPTDLFITEGFGDLPFIGDQKRPDLFALRIDKADPLCEQIIEVCERLDADGEPLVQPNLVSLDRHQEGEQGSRTAAVCLMHSYKNSAHEEQVADALRKSGYEYISVSSQLSPLIKIIPRLQTTVVNAYLSPVLQNYIRSIDRRLAKGSFRMMTSAGGLVRVERFNPKDSLLSGPAGGVVGAASVGKQSGFNKIISFDMGGTSTDVARYDHGYEYDFEYTVGNARLAAPALSIETVAAGGGSICSYDGFKLSVGPESAGADPGPACYGAGGPLTLTDVNLLLGRLQPLNFGIPVSQEAAEEKFSELLDQIESRSHEPPDRNRILEGFIDIANERMADAIRTTSLRKGYDPAEYALVAFGGAGAQHACAIAGELNIGKILIPADAGLLSALGLGKAVVEEFAERQLLENLQTVISDLPDLFDSLEEQAVEKLLGEGIEEDDIEIRRRAIFMRLSGQESTLELEFSSGTQV